MIRPHTRPSRTRRTAEVDHRRSGTHFVWKNTGFRASAISQKRISCETSFKTPSATHPPAPLAIPFTLRERSYSCKSQWNSVDRTCTKNTWNPIYNAEPIRPWSDHGPRMIRTWSENDPTTHETVSHPSHRRGRSSTFGDALCLEKHRVSCICYLSKTHFVRDFLQNSIGNSSTTAPLAIPFTLRERSYSCKSQWNSVDRTCTKNTWNPMTMRNRSDHDPTMVREWSENDPTTHETVSHPSHRRGRSSTFGDALCLEKHRVSCICYLSKTHFVRDFLQNSIGNSSSSTTCNPIYIAGSQKRISCETSFKTPSATHPPAPLAIPFTLREQFLWLTLWLTLSLTNSFPH